MKTYILMVLLVFSQHLRSQQIISSLSINECVDSINILLQSYTDYKPVLYVQASGDAQIVYKDGGRFIFNLAELYDDEYAQGQQYKGIELQLYNPGAKGQNNFIYFHTSGKGDAFIKFGRIPEDKLKIIYNRFIYLRKQFE